MDRLERRAALAAVEAKVPVRSTLKAAELASLSALFRAVPDYRSRIGRYPLFALLGLTACAYLAAAPCGQKDLAVFAGRLSSRQRAAPGVRRTGAGDYPAPSQPTFCRRFKRVAEDHIEQVLLAHQQQVRGAPPAGDIVVLDGKEPGHSGGLNGVTAMTSPSLHSLGSAVVPDKTNEISTVRELCERLDPEGRLVSIDALPTQSETARRIVLGARRRFSDDRQSQSTWRPGGGAGARARSGLPFFAPVRDPACIKWTDLEKNEPVTRTLVARALDGETAGFPLMAQAARVRRERLGKKPETVELITSRPPAELSLAQWLEANINHWGIETGLHARLDASRDDDRCRLRTPKGQRIHGMFNRWANSLFKHWSEHRPNGHHMKTSDFIARMAKNHDERALRALTSLSFPSEYAMRANRRSKKAIDARAAAWPIYRLFLSPLRPFTCPSKSKSAKTSRSIVRSVA